MGFYPLQCHSLLTPLKNNLEGEFYCFDTFISTFYSFEICTVIQNKQEVTIVITVLQQLQILFSKLVFCHSINGSVITQSVERYYTATRKYET
jgi:hypothetical protein